MQCVLTAGRQRPLPCNVFDRSAEAEPVCELVTNPCYAALFWYGPISERACLNRSNLCALAHRAI